MPIYTAAICGEPIQHCKIMDTLEIQLSTTRSLTIQIGTRPHIYANHQNIWYNLHFWRFKPTNNGILNINIGIILLIRR